MPYLHINMCRYGQSRPRRVVDLKVTLHPLSAVTLCNMSKTDSHTWADIRSSFKDDQRRLIARTALELLMESGSAALTMSALADRAGMSRQTLYRYFPDLDHVLEASVEDFPAMDQQFRAMILTDPDPRTQLHLTVDVLIDATTHGGMTADELLAALPPGARDAVRAHQRRTEQLVADILTSLRGETTYDGTPTDDAALILGLVSAATDETRERTHDLIDRIIT